MKTSLRLGVFLFLGGMAIVISLTGWVLFSTQAKLAVVSGQPLAGWLLPVYLLAALFIAAIFAVGFSKWNRVSDRAVIEKTQELVQTELHRLSAGLSKLSEGDLTVQLDTQTNPLDDTWYPGCSPRSGCTITSFKKSIKSTKSSIRSPMNPASVWCMLGQTVSWKEEPAVN